MSITPITIREAVAAKLAESGPNVADAVITALANVEIEKREKAILAGLQQLDKLEKDVRKCKPDQKNLDATGAVLSETYSASKYDELKRTKEQAEKLTNAINRALNDKDFSKLFDMTAGKAEA